MSQISKALKKMQELRENNQGRKASEIVYLTDAPKPWPKLTSIILLAAATIVALSTSIAAIIISINNSDSKQIQVLNMAKTIRNQEKRIDDFIIAVNHNQKYTDNQIHNLNDRLIKEINDFNLQINNSASSDSTHYENLKQAVLDAKQEIDILNNYTKKLDQKIETVSASVIQSASQPQNAADSSAEAKPSSLTDPFAQTASSAQNNTSP